MDRPDRERGSQPTLYEIVVWGTLDDDWSDWFNGMSLALERGPGRRVRTTLIGPVADQAKLRGILSRIWNLNLVVVSVSRLDPEPEQAKGQQGGG
jgi:hypothetical protein